MHRTACARARHHTACERCHRVPADDEEDEEDKEENIRDKEENIARRQDGRCAGAQEAQEVAAVVRRCASTSRR